MVTDLAWTRRGPWLPSEITCQITIRTKRRDKQIKLLPTEIKSPAENHQVYSNHWLAIAGNSSTNESRHFGCMVYHSAPNRITEAHAQETSFCYGNQSH